MHRNLVCDLYKHILELNNEISALNERVFLLKDKLMMNKVPFNEDNKQVYKK